MKFKSSFVILVVLLATIFTGCSQADNKNEITNNSEVIFVNKDIKETEEKVEEKKEENDVILSLDDLKFNLSTQFENKELKELSLEELSILRNSIYAKNGYIFSTKEYNDYFSQFSWYIPLSKKVEEKLNNIDNENIKNILNFENEEVLAIKSFRDNNDQKEFAILSYKDHKIKRNDGEINIALKGNIEKETLFISSEKLENCESGNFPTRITLKNNNSEIIFESSWNDGIFVSVVDFDDKDEELDVYVTETGTDIACTTYIYKINNEKIYKYAEFDHFGKEFLYDEKGNIYYWFYDTNKMEINTCFNYKTKECSNIWDQNIKNRLSNCCVF